MRENNFWKTKQIQKMLILTTFWMLTQYSCILSQCVLQAIKCEILSCDNDSFVQKSGFTKHRIHKVADSQSIGLTKPWIHKVMASQGFGLTKNCIHKSWIHKPWIRNVFIYIFFFVYLKNVFDTQDFFFF